MRAALVLTLAAGLMAGCLLPAEAAYNASPATFKKDCSPGDAPAFKIIIPKDGAQLLIRLWGDALTDLGNSPSFAIRSDTPRSQVNTDLFICANTRCAPSDGYLRIGQYKADQTLDGELLWTTPSGQPVSIPFVASYIAVDPPCEE